MRAFSILVSTNSKLFSAAMLLLMLFNFFVLFFLLFVIVVTLFSSPCLPELLAVFLSTLQTLNICYVENIYHDLLVCNSIELPLLPLQVFDFHKFFLFIVFLFRASLWVALLLSSGCGRNFHQVFCMQLTEQYITCGDTE